jgi:anoctamin-10
VYTYVTSTPDQGGLGIANGAKKWPRVKSVFTLHDRQFNHEWITSWTKRQLGFNITANELEVVKNQFGEAVALYYSFLSSYAMALVFPTLIGVAFWGFEQPYNPIYSIFVVIWSVVFVEWWRIRERKLAVRWGTRGAIKVEKLRVEFHPVRKMDDDDADAGFPWYKREIRVLTSLPVIGASAVILAILLTGIFVVEAFVTQLYTGPGHQVASLVPTILFTGLVSQFLGIYHKFAVALSE